jgi:basic membrane lipoprotein Med (substrate-binding protein (PBP1-ABC) superfamily)
MLNLFTPFNQTINLLKKLDNKVKFIHVTRDKNKEADNLVNVTFDEN